ncbi:hypothetical protein [Neobacillus sp. D3-1R]
MFILLGCQDGLNQNSVDNHGVIIDVNKENKEILVDDKEMDSFELIYLK